MVDELHPLGQVWDIEDSIPLVKEMEIIPSNQYKYLADSDIIIVTAGVQPKLGQTRLDTLSDNALTQIEPHKWETRISHKRCDRYDQTFIRLRF